MLNFKKLWSTSLLLVVGTLSAQSVDNCNWPTMNHDHDNTRTNPCETIIGPDNVGNLVLSWSFAAPGSVQGAPVVVGTTVYFTDTTGNLYAKNVATGADVFPSVNLGAACEGGTLVTVDTIYTTTSDLRLHARNLDLTPKVAFNGGSVVVNPDAVGRAQILACPILVDNIVIIPIVNNLAEVTTNINTTLRGGFQAFNATTGQFLWRRALLRNDQGTSGGSLSTGAIDTELGLFFAGSSNATSPPAGKFTNALLAIDYRTGKIRWARQYTKNGVWGALYPCGNDYDLGASPNLFEITHKGKTYKVVGAASKTGVYRVFDRATGRTVWEKLLKPKDNESNVLTPEVTSINGNPGAAYHDGVIYTSTNVDRSGRPFNVISILAQNSNLGALIALGDGLVNTDYNYLHAVRAKDGKILWTSTTQSSTFTSLTQANGVIYVGNVRGLFMALDAKTGEFLRSEQIPAGGILGAPITVAGGRVFVGVNIGGPGSIRVYNLP